MIVKKGEALTEGGKGKGSINELNGTCMVRMSRTRKVTRNSCVFHVIKGFREEFLVIKDEDEKWQGRNLAVWAKRGKWYFNIQLLGKRIRVFPGVREPAVQI